MIKIILQPSAYDREGNQESTVRIANAGNSLLRNFRIIGGKGDWCGDCSLPSGDEHSGGGIFIDVTIGMINHQRLD